ncbi:MAG: DsbA family protein [Chromatiaceae bacterium]
MVSESKNGQGEGITHMDKQAALTISYFSDVLCVWAYAAQIKLDELRRQFGDQIRLEYHFLPLFGDVSAHIDDGWADRGGAAGYARHVKQVAARFDRIDIHPEIWTRNMPSTSASCHLFLKAVQLVEKSGAISAAPQARFDGKSLFEEAVWRCRLAFFRDLQDIADRNQQEAIASDIGLPLADIRRQIDGGAAYAALCTDFAAKEKYLVEGSPTFLLHEGRQKLYGNVGYRVIEANIQELLADPGDRASWC